MVANYCHPFIPRRWEDTQRVSRNSHYFSKKTFIHLSTHPSVFCSDKTCVCTHFLFPSITNASSIMSITCHPKTGMDTSFAKCSAVSVWQNKCKKSEEEILQQGGAEEGCWNKDRNGKVKRKRYAYAHEVYINQRTAVHVPCDKWKRIMDSWQRKMWRSVVIIL